MATKLKVAPKTVLPLEANPLADWSGHLFTADRMQYVILTNTASLYSAISFAREITNDSRFIVGALAVIREMLADDGLEEVTLRMIVPETGTVRFSKALNRSVIGSMNDIVNHSKFFLLERGESPFDAAQKMNDMPLSMLKYNHPREVFSLLVEQRSADNAASAK